MKGLFATILVISLTGIVNPLSAQQILPDSSFDARNSGSSASQSKDFSPLGQTPAADRAPYVGIEGYCYELTIDQRVLNDLLERGQVVSTINEKIRPNVVSVKFSSDNQIGNGQSNSDVAPQRIRPLENQNGVLVFEFSEDNLQAIERGNLLYNLDPREVGSYHSVVVRLAGRKPDPSMSFDSGRTGLSSSNPQSGLGLDQRSPSSAFNQRSPDSGIFQNPPTTGIPDRYADRTNNLSSRDLAEPNMNHWRNDLQTGVATQGFADKDEFVRRRMEHLNNVKNDLMVRETDLQYRERRLAEQEQRLRDELARSSNLTPVSQSSWSNSSTSWPNGSSYGSLYDGLRNSGVDNRIAAGISETTSLLARDDSKAYTTPTAFSDHSVLSDLKSTIRNGFTAINQHVDNLNHRISRIESGTQSNGYRDGVGDSNYDFRKNMQAKIPGLQSDGSQDGTSNSQQNMSVPLYFMLLASLGLNAYLGLMARNFYARYNELADELRDTFSASVSS